MLRRCTHFSAEFLRRQPCRRCVHCHGWIDERGRVLSDAAALRRYPQHAAEIRAQSETTPAPRIGEQFLHVAAAVVAVGWRLALFLLALPIVVLALMVCWAIITA